MIDLSISGSDVTIPRHFYFPKNREFLGIQANFLGNPENAMKCTVTPDLDGIVVSFGA